MTRNLTRCTRAALVLATLVIAALTWAIPANALDEGSLESGFVAQINALRASKGLNALTVDPELTRVARAWATHMGMQRAISHNPDLGAQVTAPWVKLGENVGMGPDFDVLFKAFVASPEHYRNLVDPTWTHVGVGVVLVNDVIFTAHEFMALEPTAQPEAAPATSAPASPPTTSAPSVTTSVVAPAPTPTPAPAPAAQPTPGQLVGVIDMLHALDASSS